MYRVHFLSSILSLASASRHAAGMFTSAATGAQHHSVRCCTTAAPSFSSAEWVALQQHLDTLPVFTCVNQAGEPLGYERDGKSLSIYFADVERAQRELETMSEQYASLNLRLLGAGLGAVFQQHIEGSALLVPGAAALAGAGDAWDSDVLPLYTCLALSSQAPEGTGLDLAPGAPTTPLFLCPSDAQASLGAAVDAASSRGVPEAQLAAMQLQVCSLPTAIDIVLSGREAETCGDRFQFVAPRSSLFFLRDQQAARQAAARRREPPKEDASGLLFPS